MRYELDSSLTEATVEVVAYVNQISGGKLSDVSVEIEGVHKKTVSARVDSDGFATLVTGWKVSDVRLWWPVGFGAQELYTVKVTFDSQVVERKIGFRKVELVQEPIVSELSSDSV